MGDESLLMINGKGILTALLFIEQMAALQLSILITNTFAGM
jgi:L-aminopeptidase/D-esterase-like protein